MKRHEDWYPSDTMSNGAIPERFTAADGPMDVPTLEHHNPSTLFDHDDNGRPTQYAEVLAPGVNIRLEGDLDQPQRPRGRKAESLDDEWREREKLTDEWLKDNNLKL